MCASMVRLATMLFLTACTKEQSDDLPLSTPVYQDLKVLYHKTEHRTRAYATFRKTNNLGVRLKLTGGSMITSSNEAHANYTELDNYFYRSCACSGTICASSKRRAASAFKLIMPKSIQGEPLPLQHRLRIIRPAHVLGGLHHVLTRDRLVDAGIHHPHHVCNVLRFGHVAVEAVGDGLREVPHTRGHGG